MMPFLRRGLSLLALVAACGWMSPRAAAPEIIVFAGDGLEEKILVTGWAENHEFIRALSASEAVTVTVPNGAYVIDVHLYWGFHWRVCARNADCLRSLSADAANQRARLYVVSNGAATLYMTLDGAAITGARTLSPAVLSWFDRHGIRKDHE